MVDFAFVDPLGLPLCFGAAIADSVSVAGFVLGLPARFFCPSACVSPSSFSCTVPDLVDVVVVVGFLPRPVVAVVDPAGLPLAFVVEDLSVVFITPSSSSVSSSVSSSAGLLIDDKFVRAVRFLPSVAEVGAFAFVVFAAGLAPALLVAVVVRFAVRVARAGDTAGITAARAMV